MTDKVSNTKRREFLKKSAYVAPAILTLSAIPSIAQSGSGDYVAQPSSDGGYTRPRHGGFTRHHRNRW